MVISLPQDVILFQIISRVPPKSVSRFKCVSKQWKSFLMSDRFKEMHSQNLLKDPQLEDHNLLFYSKAAATFFAIDCESLSIKTPRPRPLPQFLASPPRYVSILTSYHGLVCLLIATEYYCIQGIHIILWNPLTTEYKRLSKPANPDHMECYLTFGRGYGLYYSSFEDDYKLLVVTFSRNVYIYSLKSDLWRKLNKKSPFKETNCWTPGLCCENNLYFLLDDTSDQSLIRFDTKAERFHKIEFPHKYEKTYYPHFATTVHKGSIHLCVNYNIYGRTSFVKRTCIELWNFKADRDIWSKVVTYQLRPNDDIGYMFPFHLMSNGNWLMKDHREKGRIYQVELKKYTKDKDGHDEYKLYHSNVVEGYPEEVRYAETFVSPNRYMK